jgi:hypothetical protein
MIKKPKNKNIVVADDIRKTFSVLIKMPMLYHITISETKAKHAQDLRHILTNKLFNTLNKQYGKENHFINYLFVIEYASSISKGDSEIKNCGEHAHIIVSTSIPQHCVKKQIDAAFNGEYNCLIQSLSDRNDKENLVNYLLKQEKLLRKDNYNYKISLDSKPIKIICYD